MLPVFYILLLVFGFPIAFLMIITYVFFPKHDQYLPVDVYLVLGAAPAKDGTLSKLMRSRVDTVVKAYQNNRKPILFTGGTPYSKVSEASMMADYTIIQGVNPSDILYETQARNTYENFLYSSAILKRYGLQRIGLVTSDFHMRRASFFARKFDLDFMCIPALLKPYAPKSYRCTLLIVESFLRLRCLIIELKNNKKTA